MKINNLLLGLLITTLVVYKIKTFKIGPCSPEMELLINGK